MKISISKKVLLVSLIALIAIIIAFALFYLIEKNLPKEFNTYDFYGTVMKFRTDLRKANNIQLYPDNETIQTILWGENIQNLTIAFVDSTDNGKVALEAVDITNKMQIAYLMFNRNIHIKARILESYDNISASEDFPVIALVPPAFTNETIVSAENNTIYIKGSSQDNFDLATTKLLMVALVVNLSNIDTK